jgi:hypothetical protein
VLDCTGHPSEGWNLNHTRELTRAFYFIFKRKKPVIMDFIYEKIPNIIFFSFFTILALFSQFSELRRALRRGHERKGKEMKFKNLGHQIIVFLNNIFFVVERCGFMSSIL